MARSNDGDLLSAAKLEEYHTDDVEIVASGGGKYRVKLVGVPGNGQWALKTSLHPINVERWRLGREQREAEKARVAARRARKKRPRSSTQLREENDKADYEAKQQQNKKVCQTYRLKLNTAR